MKKRGLMKQHRVLIAGLILLAACASPVLAIERTAEKRTARASTVQEPSRQEPAMRELTMQAPTMQEPATQAPTIQEPAVEQSEQPVREFLLLATNKTSTLEEELNEAADAGYRFRAVMGGDTAFGGDEAVAIMERVDGGEPQRYEYKLLATSRTSTMQREAQEAADAGFQYKGQTVFSSMFGGDEVVLILERDIEMPPEPYEVLLLATSRTSTMQEELREAADAGYEFVGFTVGETSFRGNEVVSIMKRRISR